MEVNLTDKRAAAIKPQNQRFFVRDGKVPELRLRVSPSGRKVWLLRVSNRGKWSSSNIGVFMESGAADIELSVDDARHQARHELALAGKQGSLNRDQAAISEMPTLDEWYQEFKVKNPRRFVETTVRDNTTRMAQYISPRLGKTPLHKIRT